MSQIRGDVLVIGTGFVLAVLLAFLLGVAVTLWAVQEPAPHTALATEMGGGEATDARPPDPDATDTGRIAVPDPLPADSPTANNRPAADSLADITEAGSPPPAPASAAARPAGGGPAEGGRRTYQVRIGAFLDADNAAEAGEAAKALGLPVEIVAQPDSQGRDWYVVQVGPYWDRLEALDVAGKLRRSQGFDALIIGIDSRGGSGSGQGS
ncbi:MAG: SPOR domain-containing protein [Rhodospirillales bacterium]|nr:MAG: SPOR domain-containing protein [Rhodospirillales bacterium]